MSAKFDVFDYDRFGALLEAYRLRPPERRLPYTLEELAHRFGFRSPRSVAMVIKGQRLPNVPLVQGLIKALKARSDEARYVDLLAKKERLLRKPEADLSELIAEIQGFRRTKLRPTLLDLQTFSALSDWQHLAVKQLVAAPGFREDGEWVSRRLKGKISPEQAVRALETLEAVGTLDRDEKGKLRVAPMKAQLATEPDRASLAARRHHAQMMQRAVEGLVEIAPEDREFISLTTRMAPKDMADAKKAIRDFVTGFSRRFTDSESGEVFQMNLQFFAHTPCGPEKER